MPTLKFFNKLFSLRAEGVGPRVRSISGRDRERMFFFMSMMLKAGQTTVESLRMVGKAFKLEGKEEIAAGLQAISQRVAQGRALSKASEIEPVLFQDVHRAAILAGEAANSMAESFNVLRKLEDKKIEAGRSGVAELLTPLALLVLSLASMLNSGVNTLPVMAGLAEAQGKELAMLPRMVMMVSQWIIGHWVLFAAVFGVGAALVISTIRTPQGRFMWDDYLLRVPVLGRFISYKTYAGMLLYFPHLLASGVKPKQMAPIMETMATNVVLKRRIDMFNQTITTGGQLSDAMRKAGFPEIVLTPVTVSESYATKEEGVNDAMIEGMTHAYGILDRMLTDTHNQFVAIASVILWCLGGLFMLMEMLSIVMAQG